MAYPTVEVSGRTIIVLHPIADCETRNDRREKDDLCAVREAARRYPDAVAFGYFDGAWFPAA